MRATLRSLVLAWLAGTLFFVVGAAEAQILDTVEVTHDGTNALVRIRFAALIQYLRHAPQSSGELVQVFFQITAGEEGTIGTREEQRRSPPSDLVPRFDVIYPPQPAGQQRRIEVRFTAPVNFRLRPEDNRTILLTIPLSAAQIARLTPARPAGVAPPPSAAAPTTELDRQAVPLMNTARDALAAGDFETAAQNLNRVLNLPPNIFSQEAQELIGIAREKLGEIARARAEYELYLKLYPDGPGADRVRARLAELKVAPVLGGGAPGATPIPPLYTAWGSVAQYYYGGQSQVETTTTTVTPATNATTIDTARLTAVDQSQLVTIADVTGRWREGPWDTRFVFRDNYTWNFLRDGNNRNRMNALYAETRYAPNNFFARLGRQSATSGGVLGRFDGLWASIGIGPGNRLNGVAGQPAESTIGPTKTFAGASVDFDNILPRTSANLFGIYQKAGSSTDRVGVGAELRYFDEVRMLYALLDYDPIFAATNIAMAQGTWQFPTGTAVNLLADYRRSPTLQLTNAMVGAPGVSFDQLLAMLGTSGMRDLAKAVTPISKVYLIGFTQQINPQWQVGFDFRLSSISAISATEFAPAQPGSGNVQTYTLQAIGNSLTPWRDVLVLNGSVLRGSLLDGWQAGADYRFSPIEPLTIQPMLRYYQQSDTSNTRLTRWTPGLRVVWFIRPRVSLEAEGARERTKSNGNFVFDSTDRWFYYAGWRWDF